MINEILQQNNQLLEKYKCYENIIRMVKALEPKTWYLELDTDVFIKIKDDGEAYLLRNTWIDEIERDIFDDLLYINTRLKLTEEPIYSFSHDNMLKLFKEIEKLF